jgi:hypothetical protein
MKILYGHDTAIYTLGDYIKKTCKISNMISGNLKSIKKEAEEKVFAEDVERIKDIVLQVQDLCENWLVVDQVNEKKNSLCCVNKYFLEIYL